MIGTDQESKIKSPFAYSLNQITVSVDSKIFMLVSSPKSNI